MTKLIEEKVKQKLNEFEHKFTGEATCLEHQADCRCAVEDWLREAFTDLISQREGEIVEMLEGMKEKAIRDMLAAHRLAPNSYGEGVEWGAQNVLEDAINNIRV